MRILITGAGGTLGTVLAPALAATGHEPVLFDIQPLRSSYQFIQGDVREPEDARRAIAGVDLVVHTAAIHGIHLGDHSAQEFYDLNIGGTFNLWEAAAGAGVRGLVFSSTLAVYGQAGRPRSATEVVALSEDSPLLPGDIYGFSKVVGEDRRGDVPLLPTQGRYPQHSATLRQFRARLLLSRRHPPALRRSKCR